MTQIFEIHRDVDITGLSGTGIVADGAVFPDGTTVVRWRELDAGTENYKRGVRATTVVHPNVESVEALHGHGGATRLVFTDDRGAARNAVAEGFALYADEDDKARSDIESDPLFDNSKLFGTGHSDGPHVRFDASGHYINPPLNNVTEDPA